MPTKVKGLVIGWQSQAFPSGYSVVLSYALSPQGPAAHETPAAPVNKDATFEQSLSDAPAEMSSITAILFDAAGQVVVKSPVTAAQVRAASVGVRGQVRPIEISVKGIDLGAQPSGQPQPTQTPQSPAAPPDNMVAGRLVDMAGGCSSCGRLVFFGTPKNTTEARPIGATGTDRRGNFLIPKPAGNYSAVYAIAPGFVDLNGNAQFQVPLDSSGAFSSSILLVGVQKVAQDPNCECGPSTPRAPGAGQLTDPSAPYSQDLGGGACVQLTTPNRTLETFVYTTLVRVDEPRPLSNPDPAAATEVADLDSVGLAAAAGTVSGYLKTQAVTVSHAHLLEFDQLWKAHGYSLGDLLYSLPLAPCQKKQIAVVDWERREAGARSEVSTLQDQLVNTLTRDRDISEIVNGVLTENVKGSSAATVAGGAAGIGVAGSGSYGGANLGGVISAFGGGGSANSGAAQDAARGITANSLQHIQDRTSQVAQMVRSLRTTVVQTVTQAEIVKATTEVVANHNHCHALTIEYFEVLRHFLVEHHLVNVRECILVPFLITPFDAKRALQWREEIAPALIEGKWTSAFDAAQRVVNFVPPAEGADDLIDLEIDLQVSMRIERPMDRTTYGSADALGGDQDPQGPQYQGSTPVQKSAGAPDDPWNPLIELSNTNDEPVKKLLFVEWYLNHYLYEPIPPKNDEKNHDLLMTRLAERENDFQTELAGKIAIQFMRQVQASIPGHLDSSFFRVTLLDRFQSDTPLTTGVRLKKPLPGGIKASQVQQIQLQTRFHLPLGSRVVVRAATIRFRTARSEWRIADASVDGDLADGSNLPVILVVLPASASNAPAATDTQAADALVDHLNHNIEYYHRAIWTNLDPGHRFLLLDSLFDPKLDSRRRVASLVENRILGFLGNSMILPAAPGVHFDFFQPAGGTLVTSGQSLVGYYSPLSNDGARTRISLPTRGVFAEAILGECNACETKDDARFWRWEQSPCPDEPTAIQPVSTASRATPAPNLQAAPFPQSVINIQNAPAEPDPTGLKSALTLLGTSNLFKDITGVDQVNKNAIQAFSIAAQGAEQLASQAAGLVKQQAMQQGGYDQQQKRIKQAEADGSITKQQANELTYKALQAYGGQNSSTKSDTAGAGSTGASGAKGATGSGKPRGDTGSAPKSGGSGSGGSGLIFVGTDSSIADLLGDIPQSDRKLLATIKGVRVETVGNESAFFFKTTFGVDADGSPRAYHRDDARALDYLANACDGSDASLCFSGSKEWHGIVAGSDPANPPIQSSGFFVSQTSLFDESITDRTDQSRYVNSEQVPYIVLPNNKKVFTLPNVHTIGTATLGDFAFVINSKTGAHSYAIVAEDGNIGEGSIELANRLGYNASPKHGGSIDPIICLVFPDTRRTPAWPVDPSDFENIGSAAFRDWGGILRLAQLFPELLKKTGAIPPGPDILA